jgi:hypothetical protein
MRTLLATGMLLSMSTFDAAPAADVRFAAPLTVTKDGETATIRFALSAPADVAVDVEDAAGKVVRHLAGGVLGKNPPPPLKPDSLDQTVVWDGKDDADKPAAGGPFKVRVKAGMRPEFDGFLLENPASTGPTHSLAVGPKGSLYAFHADATTGAGHWGSTKIKVLSRDGKYQQTIMPFPADIAAAKVEPLGGTHATVTPGQLSVAVAV